MNCNIAVAILTLSVVVSGCATYSPNRSAAGWHEQEAELEREYESCLADQAVDCAGEHRDLHQHLQWDLLNRSNRYSTQLVGRTPN
jgi:hypothetical protein